MEWSVEQLGSIAGILGFVVSLLALLRDAFDVKVNWSNSRNLIKRLAVNRYLHITTIIALFCFFFGTLFIRIQELVSEINTKKSELLYATSTIAYLKETITSNETSPLTETKTLIVTPTPDSSYLSIEDIIESINPYSFTQSRTITPTVKLSVVRSLDFQLDYRFDFLTPEVEDAVTGLAIQLREPIDISEYTHIELTIEFEKGDTEFSLVINDIAQGSSYILFGDSKPFGNGIISTMNGKRQHIRIPLKENFEKTNKKFVNSLFLVTGSNLSPVGENNIVIRDIRIVKQ
ncbi:MAG TPA: hypothetical protein VFS21_24430 [Roseiflexaceae bacterium]|nr:hypothetical protein [Roseiflexaceae bacterium]